MRLALLIPSFNLLGMGNNPYRHRHLNRLDRLWIHDPIYFVTVCIHGRQPLLACEQAHEILHEVWDKGELLHGWRVGPYVVMPDHVHFFCSGTLECAPLRTFVGKWKEWTAKLLNRRHHYAVPLWQPRFFDHVLRSEESYTAKWSYVQQNPVRAGLVTEHSEWPYWGSRHQL